MKSFYMTLPSNVSSKDYFESNKIGNWKTKLAKPVNLFGSWEVALVEVSYTKSWYNIIETGHCYYIEYDRQNDVLTYPSSQGRISNIVKPGYYGTPFQLIAEINKNLTRLSPVNPPTVSYEHITCRALVTPVVAGQSYLYPRFNDEIMEMFGLTRHYANMSQITPSPADKLGPAGIFSPKRGVGLADYHPITPHFSQQMRISMKGGATLIGTRPVDLSGGRHSLFVYADVVEPNIVGDSHTRLLKVVEIPTEPGFGEQVVIHYDTPMYKPVLKTNFDSIEIDIKDDVGTTVPFTFGRSICTLHFREKK